MCLAVPARVVSAGPRPKGRVDYMGTTIGADLSLLDDVRVGDWVIVHAGFAIAKLDEAEARRTLGYLKEMAEPAFPQPGEASAAAKAARPARRARPRRRA